MEQLRKCRDLPKAPKKAPKAPAPRKKITKQSEIVSRPKNPSTHPVRKLPGKNRFGAVWLNWSRRKQLLIVKRQLSLSKRKRKRGLDKLTRTETYLENYRKQIATENQLKYTSGLSKVVEQFAWANNHATKWMPPPVLEAYRTAFLTILYEEIDREFNEKEAEEITRFLNTKNFDYLRRKKKQFFETGKIEFEMVE
ncbi:unnamed protein product [Caenorhabditis brenneri]